MNATSFDEMEQVYEALAQAIDRAGAERESLFLARLALLLGHRAGSFEIFRQCVDAALADLNAPDGKRSP